MRRLLMTIAMILAITTTAYAQKEANGLKVTASDSTIKFQTVVQGDSIYKVHERFGLSGNLKTDWPKILNEWRAANPEISTKNDWIFQKGITYTVPAEYAEAFRNAAGLNEQKVPEQKPAKPDSTLDSKAAQAAGQQKPPADDKKPANDKAVGISSWVLPAFLAFASIGFLLFLARRSKAINDLKKALGIEQKNAEQLSERLEEERRLNERLEEERRLNKPAEQVGPPIVEGGINPMSPDAAADVNKQLEAVAQRLREEIESMGPVTFAALEYDEEARVLNATGNAIVITGLGQKIGPAYRGYVEGSLKVLGGDGEWREARGHGDPCYFAFFRVTTPEGETETALPFLEICCNDIRFRRNRYTLFDGRVINCSVVEGTGVRPASTATSRAEGEDAATDTTAEGDEDGDKRRAYELATTPFEHQRTKHEAFFAFVFGTQENPTADGQAERMELLLRYNLLPDRPVEAVTAEPVMAAVDFDVATVRAAYLLKDKQGVYGKPAREIADDVVSTINGLAEHGRDIQVYMMTPVFGTQPIPVIDADPAKRRVLSDDAVLGEIEKNPDLFAESLFVALSKTRAQLNAWLANMTPELSPEARQAIIAYTNAVHASDSRLIGTLADRAAAEAEMIRQTAASMNDVFDGMSQGGRRKQVAAEFVKSGKKELESGNAVAASYCAQAAMALYTRCEGAQELLELAEASIVNSAPKSDVVGDAPVV